MRRVPRWSTAVKHHRDGSSCARRRLSAKDTIFAGAEIAGGTGPETVAKVQRCAGRLSALCGPGGHEWMALSGVRLQTMTSYRFHKDREPCGTHGVESEEAEAAHGHVLLVRV